MSSVKKGLAQKSNHLLARFRIVFVSVGFIAFSFSASTISSSTRISRIADHFALSDKLNHLHMNADPAQRQQGKSSGIVRLQIQNEDQNRVTAGSSLNLVAKIQSPSMNYNDLEYVWLLPDGVTLENGSLNGVLGPIEAGGEINLHLRVIQNVDLNQQIHLHVFHRINGEAVGQIAQFNTLEQSHIEANVRAKAQLLQVRKPASADSASVGADPLGYRVMQ